MKVRACIFILIFEKLYNIHSVFPDASLFFNILLAKKLFGVALGVFK